METLKPSNFSFIIVNLVNKDILHFLITNGLTTDCCRTESVHKFVGRALQNHEKSLKW